ncbi:hypothetical protein VPH35_011120 [Triticum aestivum]
MPNMTVTRSSPEDPHVTAGEQQQPQLQAADKAPRTTEEEPADFINLSRINPEYAPVPNGIDNGSGSAAIRKQAEPAPSPTPSMDDRDDAPAVDADSSSLASYLARASLEQRRPGGRPASSSAAIVSDHQLHNAAAHSSQGLNLGGGLYNLATQASEASNSHDGRLYNLAAQATYSSSCCITIAAPEDPTPLKWGRKKRSCARREPHAPTSAPVPAPAPVSTPAPAPVPTSTSAPEPELIPALAHCRAILRLKKRPAAQGQAQPRAEAEKLMPPPSARGPVILDTSPHTPRAATVSPWPPHAATLSPLPPRAATLLQHRSSAEDPHAAAGEQQQAADKAPRTAEQEPVPKVHEPKPPPQQPRRKPYRQAADKAAHATSNGEQEPAPKVQPRQPTPQRQQPPRQASMKEKGKAPMVQEPPAVAPHVAQRAAAAVAAAARPPAPFVATQLTRREKEEDWFAMTCGRLPYRPMQRRPKAVEDKLQKMSPGQTLPERPGLRAMAEEDAVSSKRHDSDDDAAGEKNHFGVADVEDCGSRRKRG